MKYNEILSENIRLKKLNQSKPSYNIMILSNIIMNQISNFLEYSLQSIGVNANVRCGNYDNILQDSVEISDQHMVLIFWECCNLIDGFQYKSESMDEVALNNLLEKTKYEIDIVFKNLQKCPTVIMNRFSTLAFNSALLSENNFDKVCQELNEHLNQIKSKNEIFVEIDKVIASVSVEKSFDMRNFYSSKALYSTDFYKKYTEYISPIVGSFMGKSKKALVLDCDNTLWYGIVGEDGMKGIQMSSKTVKGVPFEEVQFLAKALADQGVIICLNSKNNENDVNEVLNAHESMILTDDEIVMKMINWEDKVSNLEALASSLNIGTDSLVFVDDSSFEIEHVREYLPEVKLMQVPKNSYEYPTQFRKLINSFFELKKTKTDHLRIESYKSNIKRSEAQSKSDNLEQYLSSLELSMSIAINSKEQLDRMAQLTQKTNQFNLTTKRYTTKDVFEMIENPSWITFIFQAKDKFGDFGYTGECFILINGRKAYIDTFLMSCRVLGRNLEFKFMYEILKYLKKEGVKVIMATYIKTLKNTQVENFYDQFGFTRIKDIEGLKEYELPSLEIGEENFNYIKVNYE